MHKDTHLRFKFLCKGLEVYLAHTLLLPCFNHLPSATKQKTRCEAQSSAAKTRAVLLRGGPRALCVLPRRRPLARSLAMIRFQGVRVPELLGASLADTLKGLDCLLSVYPVRKEVRDYLPVLLLKAAHLHCWLIWFLRFC